VRSLPQYVAVHLRRGDYLHHCAKVKKGSVKEWISFTKLPAQSSSLFLGSSPSSSRTARANPLLATSVPLRSESNAERGDPAIPGCYPSLTDIETAFDHIAETTGVRNFFVATNTPRELVNAGIVDPYDDGVDIFAPPQNAAGQQQQQRAVAAAVDASKLLAAKKRASVDASSGKRKRQWRAVVLPAQSAKLFFADARGVDDVILEMALLSLGRVFLLNRFSSFSATALEMAILRQHVAEDHGEWDNVVTW
jgi:hypothetical protein